MKRWVKILICLLVITLSVGLIVYTTMYLKDNYDKVNNEEIAFSEEVAIAVDEGSTSGQASGSEEEVEQNKDEVIMTTNEEVTGSPDDVVSSDKEIPSSDETNDTDINAYDSVSGMEKSATVESDNNLLSSENTIYGIEISYVVLLAVGSLLFTISFLYLLFSKFCDRAVFINGDKIAIFILSSIIMVSLLTIALVYYIGNYIL